MKQAFTLFHFEAKNHHVELVLPETWQAEELYQQLQKNKEQFSKWLKWAGNINSAKKEAESIKTFQQKMVDGIAFNLVFLIDNQPAGMLDLHCLNKSSGEVGYWLAGDFQHLGIMTKSVKMLVQYAFDQLNLDYLILRTAPNNFASQNVAKRTGFKFVKLDENGHKMFRLDK